MTVAGASEVRAPFAPPTSAPRTPFLAPELAPPVDWPATGRRYLRPRPVTLALTGLAGLAALLWLATEQKPQLAIAAVIVVAVVIDAVLARAALADLTLEVHDAEELVAGQTTHWTLQVKGVRRPVVVGPSVMTRTHQVRVQSDAPGRITLPALSRGLARSLVFDVTAVGPIGLFEAGRRYRVQLGSGLHVGPPALPHRLEWPRPKAVRFGASEVAPIGDDLFRSVRPYVRGDSRRRVHWKATAHHGHLMISESDGTGMVALRIVVPLMGRGPVADVTTARAAWLAEEALRRGWLVHLVTLAPEVQPPEPTVALGSPFGAPPPLPVVPPGPLRTVDRRVTNSTAIRRELAVACAGQPAVAPWRGLTCFVGPDTMEWR